MRQRPFHQVDVFTEEPLRGNPVAVVLDGVDLTDEAMQAAAAWTNLSETTFVLPPSDPAADYRLRIWTPDGELPFAGHPTLGTAHAWLASGGVPQGEGIVQECGVGLVNLRRTDGRLAFAAPSVDIADVSADEQAELLAAVGLRQDQVQRVAALTNGPRWVTFLVDSAATLLDLEPDHGALRTLSKVGVVGPHPPGHDCAIEVRAFAASIGVPEDPVTGSLNAGVGQWLIAAGVLPSRYVAAQGLRMGRRGRAHVEAADGQVWVGGGTRSIVTGEIAL